MKKSCRFKSAPSSLGVLLSAIAVLFLVSARSWAAECTYTISPLAATHSSNVSTGFVSVTASPGCAWTTFNTNAWISVLVGGTGSGNGSVLYVMGANAGPNDRMGTLNIGGQTYTVTQLGSACAFSISPASRVHTAASESGTVNIQTASGCAWTVVETNAWISLLSPTNGVGAGTLNYMVAANASSLDRSGNILVGGQTLTITQLGGGAPAITTQPASQVVPVGSFLTFSVAVSGAPAPVTYRWRFNGVDLNNGASVQGVTSTTLSLAGVQEAHAGLYSVVVTFPGGSLISADATLTVTSGALSLAQALDVDSLVVTTIGTPPWTGQTAISHDGLDAAVTGSTADSAATTIQTIVSGPGTVSFWWKVSSELNKDYLKFFVNGVEQMRISGEVDWQQRSALLSSGMQTLKWTYAKNASLSEGLDRAWVDQVQFGSVTGGCSFALSPASASHPQNPSTGLVTVAGSPGCVWNVTSTNAWITILAGGSGTESGTVTYRVEDNSSGAARTGNLVIGGQVFAVSQSGLPCAFAISPASRNHGAGLEEGSITVDTGSGCAWTVANANPWVTIVSSPNVSSGSLVYRVSPNFSASARSGIVTVAGQPFGITQGGGSVPPVQIGNMEVPSIGHHFHDLSQMLPGMPNSVVDYLIDQGGLTGGGTTLPSLNVNWDTNYQFTMTISAPQGQKFLIRVPPGRAVGFGGSMMWESTRGGSSGSGTLSVSFTGLEGPTPDFSGATILLSHSHGYFGFSDLEGLTVSQDLAFTSMTFLATVIPQFTGNGTELFVPHQESRMFAYYRTPETPDPGRFVFLVPVNEPVGGVPTMAAALQPNGDLLFTFTGVLQSATELGGGFSDVPGNPQGTYLVPKASLLGRRFYRTRTQTP